MLVLTRKAGQPVLVFTPDGDVIEFVIFKIDKNKASVGVKADKGYRIMRSEIARKTPEGWKP